MSTEPAPALSEDQHRFIEGVSALLVPWGMQPILASLYAYLLLREEPASLDLIVADLGISKSSASVAARVLEQYGLAQKYGEPRSRRVRYGASESYSGFIAAQAALLGELGHLISDRAPKVSKGPRLQRLRYLGSFFGKMERAIVQRIDELSEEAIRNEELHGTMDAGELGGGK